MSADAKEAAFHQDIIDQMVEGGWELGEPADYNRYVSIVLRQLFSEFSVASLCGPPFFGVD